MSKRLSTVLLTFIIFFSLGILVAAVTGIDLTSQVRGVLPVANGGTGSQFFTVSGPTATRTYTFPDANATVMSTTTSVAASQMPNPTASTLGGVQSGTCANGVQSISTSGVVGCMGAPSVPNFSFNETPSGTINGTNPTFTTAQTCTGLSLYKNGQHMTPGASADYQYATSTVTFNSGAIPKTGDVVLDDCKY